jgi:hypothetical protein
VDPQWIYVDLGSNRYIDSVILDWETASAMNYTLSVAVEGAADLNTEAPWTTVHVSPTYSSNPNHRLDTVTGLGAIGRYVRMFGTTRMTAYGYSLWNVHVIGSTDVSCNVDGGDAGADGGE